MSDADAQGSCSICRKPLLAGQGIYTLTMDHYDCKFPRGQESVEDALARGDAALRRMGLLVSRAKKPEGQGKTAQKAKALAATAIQQELGTEITVTTVWNQQGAYRGKHWDLDRWGLEFSFVCDGHTFTGSASSLATMTDCVKSGRLKAVPGDLAYTFDLLPGTET